MLKTYRVTFVYAGNYAIEAFEKHGFFGGLLLAVWRILRCNPFCRGGIDRVPERITLSYFTGGGK